MIMSCVRSYFEENSVGNDVMIYECEENRNKGVIWREVRIIHLDSASMSSYEIPPFIMYNYVVARRLWFSFSLGSYLVQSTSRKPLSFRISKSIAPNLFKRHD